MRDFTKSVKLFANLLFLTACVNGTSLFAQNNQKTTEVDSQRYLALQLLNLTEPTNRGPEPDIIRASAQFGLNSVYITIPWDKIYYKSPADGPQWEKYDEQIKIATDLGMKVALRIHLGRSAVRIKDYWDISDSQFSHSGKPQLSGYRDTGFGFDKQPIVNKAMAFVKEAVTRYKYLHDQKKLLFVSITNTGTQEGEYPGGLIENDKENMAVYDYSPSMVAGFRAFLKKHYTKIERLNFLWGMNYKSFDEPFPPYTAWDPSESFRQRAGKDWYIYRHEVMKNYVEQAIEIVKGVDPGIKFVSDYGSVFDGTSGVRGTMGFKNLNEKSDGVKINDSPNFDHRWSVDILKGDLPAHYITANELFVHHGLDNATHLRQIDENFEHGANIVAVVISTMESIARSEPFLRPAAAKWLNKPMEPINYAGTISYNLSAAVEKKGALNVIYDEWYRRAYADPANPRAVKIVMNEDLFTDAYWREAANHMPYIFRPVPMQIIAVNRDFTYKLPTDTFADVDGTIVRVEVSGLPGWLRYSNGQFQGRPTVLGDYRITLKAIDDEGGSTDAIFTIRVDTRENANKPPTVDANFSNQMVAIGKPFTLKIPDGAFQDSDGQITRIEASSLPAWLTFTNNTLSGTPNQLGDYRIILKAYDDLNAFVETYFTIRVVEPQFLNAPPFATSTLPVKYAQINAPFNYILPTNIFGDPDGYISAITVANRPSWLDFSLNTFSGMPTEEGEYRLIVRAYDNGGAYVEIPLVIIVQIPELHFELVQGGNKVDQRIIRKLTGNDILTYDSLPPFLNIYATGNFEYDQVTFELDGPYKKRSTTNVFPYALYQNESGFAPYIGNYTLKVTAAKEDSAIVTNSIQFSISYTGSPNITNEMTDWAFYPNPVESVLNIKLADTPPATELAYEIVHVSGKRVRVAASYVTVADNLASIDLTKLGISSGIYFVRLLSDGAVLKQYRIFKK